MVTIHEWGHFYIARLCGVKVLRFSVGFGKILYSKKDKSGTEFALAAIPLGGYVKMLDEREGDVESHLRDQAFNNKTVWQRMAIVVAGPAVNLIFAVLAYWVLFVSGVNAVIPVIGNTINGSIAHQVALPIGGEIINIDDQEIKTWQDVNLALARRIGETGTLSFKIKGGAGHEQFQIRDYHVELIDWNVDLERESPLKGLGVLPQRPKVLPEIATVIDGGRAQKAGLQVGDKVQAISGIEIGLWSELVSKVKNSAEEPLLFTVIRKNAQLELTITPAQKKLETDEKIGVIGVGVAPPKWPEHLLRNNQLGMLDAVFAAFSNTWKMITLTLDSIGKMIEGVISVKNLSGPITIAKVATQSAQSGFEAYISFLAYLSISLGVLNLLPIPMLDGGHLFYYCIEVIKGKPVSERVQQFGLRIGMALLFSMMAIAMFNDVMRL